MPPAIRQVRLWTRIDQPSLEYFELLENGSDMVLRGTILTADDGDALRVEYVVRCDAMWVTRSVQVTQTRRGKTTDLRLAVDDQRRWWRDGAEVTAVAGCIDADISLTPSTNLLPIRRLKLGEGAAADVTAAWIRLPEMQIEPLPQRYTRARTHVYHYESSGGDFTTDIEVDDAGLVVSYPPLWSTASHSQ